MTCFVALGVVPRIVPMLFQRRWGHPSGYLSFPTTAAEPVSSQVENFVWGLNLRRAFVRVSLRGVCNSVGLCSCLLMFTRRRALHSSPQSAVGKIPRTFRCPFPQTTREKKWKKKKPKPGITMAHSSVPAKLLRRFCSPVLVVPMQMRQKHSPQKKSPPLERLRGIVAAPSVAPGQCFSSLCLAFHAVACKKAECNLT